MENNRLKSVGGCMSRINLISIVVLGCLFQHSIAMDRALDFKRFDPADVIKTSKEKYMKKHMKEWADKQAKEEADQRFKVGAERDAFWNEQFGDNNKFKSLDPRLQQQIAQNYLLPRSRAEKSRVINKMCLPLVVKGLTPTKIENIEKTLFEFYDKFKKQHLKRHANESVRPAAIAYVNMENEMQEVNAEPGSRRPAGNERAVLYSNGFIEWHAKEDEQKAINELPAEKKVLAGQLYKKALEADRNISVQLGRKRLVDDRYDQLFFQDPANPDAVNDKARENFGNVQTQRVKRHNLGVQFTKIGVALSSIWFCAQIFFGENGRFGLKNFSGKVNPIFERFVIFGGITYVAGHLLIATKSLVRGIINY